MRRRRRNNPFEHEQLQDAIRLVEIITKNAQKVKGRRNPWQDEWDQSILEEFEEDPANPMFTPLNIVSASLSPKIGRKLLKVLMQDADRPENESYRDLNAGLEDETGKTYNLGEPMPASWLEEKRRGKRTYTQLERWAGDFELDYDQLSQDFDIGSKRRKRMRRKKRRGRR